MDISSVITAGILSGALVFGQTASETEFPKEIDEVTYNLVPAYVQEINWSDDSSKLNKMYTKSYIDENGVLHLYTTKDYKDDSYDIYTIAENRNNTGSNLGNGAGSGSGNQVNQGSSNNDKSSSEFYETGNTGDNNNISGDSASDSFGRHGILYSDMQEMIQAYKNAGYNHTVVRFPVTKDEPYYTSKAEFLNKVPFDEIEHIAVFGFASPDGKIPEMQEDLAEKRKNKILSYIKHEGIFIDNAEHFVCDKSVTRSLCWKVDVFYK